MSKRTPFYNFHVEAGAKFTEFGGWGMPVSYSGILEEAMAVRTSCGLFDLCHMGEFILTGEDSGKFLNRVTTRDVTKLAPGEIVYSLLCTEEGGIIDDILIYRFDDKGSPTYMVVANAANTSKDLEWLMAQEHRSEAIEIQDKSQEIGLLAIQGPKSPEILAQLTEEELSSLTYYTFRMMKVGGVDALVSRTGYTGEDGFEIYFNPSEGLQLWDKLLSAGSIIPVGLGARDVLRLEMGYTLYGNDINEDTDPLEARISWTIAWEKDEFIGKEALLRKKEKGVSRRLTAFVMDERGVPRHGSPIFYEGSEIGRVTSGTYSPYMKKEIGMGYLPIELTSPETRIEVDIRGKVRKAHVVKTPFVPSRVKKSK